MTGQSERGSENTTSSDRVEHAPARILVVDDNTEIHADFGRIFQTSSELQQLSATVSDFFGEGAAGLPAMEFTIDSALQGQAGITCVRAAVAEGQPYSVAFVDMRMPPGMSGLETIEGIWALDPDVEIVVCTAFSDHTVAEMVERLGRPDQLLILRKPFDPEEVLQSALTLSLRQREKRVSRRKFREISARVEGCAREVARFETEMADLIRQVGRASNAKVEAAAEPNRNDELIRELRASLGVPIAELMVMACRLRAIELQDPAKDLSESIYRQSHKLLDGIASLVRSHQTTSDRTAA